MSNKNGSHMNLTPVRKVWRGNEEQLQMIIDTLFVAAAVVVVFVVTAPAALIVVNEA